MVNTCGSGVTACIVDLGLKIVGAEKSKIYDGSWTEYVSDIFVRLFRVKFLSQTFQKTSGKRQVRSDFDIM